MGVDLIWLGRRLCSSSGRRVTAPLASPSVQTKERFRVEEFVNRYSGGSELAGWSSLLIYHGGFCWVLALCPSSSVSVLIILPAGVTWDEQLVGIVVEEKLVSGHLSISLLVRVLLSKEVKALKCPDEGHRERVVQMRVLLFFLKSSVVRALLLSVRSKKTG
ncbi:hypothetical protein YC2023_042458 [Brassica napus]